MYTIQNIIDKRIKSDDLKHKNSLFKSLIAGSLISMIPSLIFPAYMPIISSIIVGSFIFNNINKIGKDDQKLIDKLMKNIDQDLDKLLNISNKLYYRHNENKLTANLFMTNLLLVKFENYIDNYHLLNLKNKVKLCSLINEKRVNFINKCMVINHNKKVLDLLSKALDKENIKDFNNFFNLEKMTIEEKKLLNINLNNYYKEVNIDINKLYLTDTNDYSNFLNEIKISIEEPVKTNNSFVQDIVDAFNKKDVIIDNKEQDNSVNNIVNKESLFNEILLNNKSLMNEWSLFSNNITKLKDLNLEEEDLKIIKDFYSYHESFKEELLSYSKLSSFQEISKSIIDLLKEKNIYLEKIEMTYSQNILKELKINKKHFNALNK